MNAQDSEPNDKEVLAAYQALNQHWSHAEQERWSMLYNFLMANTILLLAWAAVYASQIPTKTPVLAVLTLGGAAISVLWLTFGARVNTFSKAMQNGAKNWRTSFAFRAWVHFTMGK